MACLKSSQVTAEPSWRKKYSFRPFLKPSQPSQVRYSPTTSAPFEYTVLVSRHTIIVIDNHSTNDYRIVYFEINAYINHITKLFSFVLPKSKLTEVVHWNVWLRSNGVGHGAAVLCELTTSQASDVFNSLHRMARKVGAEPLTVYVYKKWE